MAYVAKRTDGGDTLAFTFHGTGGDETQFHALAAELLPGGSLRDIAPTMLFLLGLPQPEAMTGRVLVELAAQEDRSARAG